MNARTPPDMSCNTTNDCGDPGQFTCNQQRNSCVCLHNGWMQPSQDDSSRVTGSSVFDFNGDGAAEVIYNDECHFRVYDGTDGGVLIEEWSESRTRIDYPVVADVDRDGNAEIVFATTNESGFCSSRGTSEAPRELFNNGIEVWGDQRDLWVPARGIWNQHAYHVTNVTEAGQVPLSEPESWTSLNGRSYNTYRSNPRNFGVAPDLIVSGVQVTSPGVACGQLGTALDIVMQVENQGDLLVGGEVLVGLYGSWDGSFEALKNDQGEPLRIPLGSGLNPKQSVLLTAQGYAPSNNGQTRLPSQVRAIIDDTMIETECLEDNNSHTVDVADGDDKADLRVELTREGASCPQAELMLRIANAGSLAVPEADVALYAGDPDQGGTELQIITVPGPIAPGATVNYAVTQSIVRRATVFAVVDPRGNIPECNDGNNTAQAPTVSCSPGDVR